MLVTMPSNKRAGKRESDCMASEMIGSRDVIGIMCKEQRVQNSDSLAAWPDSDVHWDAGAAPIRALPGDVHRPLIEPTMQAVDRRS